MKRLWNWIMRPIYRRRRAKLLARATWVECGVPGVFGYSQGDIVCFDDAVTVVVGIDYHDGRIGLVDVDTL